MADSRRKLRLKNCLDQLIGDLNHAKDKIVQIKEDMLDGRADPLMVSSSYISLSGFVQEFNEEVEEMFPTLATQQSLTSPSSQCTQPATSIHPAAHMPESRLPISEILERVGILEKLQTETTIFKTESQKAQSDLSDQIKGLGGTLTAVQSKQESCQATVDQLTEVVFGSIGQGKTKMDFPAICDKVETLQTLQADARHRGQAMDRRMDVGDARTSKLEKTVLWVQGKVVDNCESMTDFQKQTEETKHELAGLQITLKKHEEKTAETEVKMNERVTQVESKVKRECSSMKEQTNGLLKLRKVLNRCHFRSQQTTEQQAQIDELQRRVDLSEEQEEKELVCFRANVNTKDRLIWKNSRLNDVEEIFINEGGGFKPMGLFIPPVDGFYSIGLSAYQSSDGQTNLFVSCNGSATSSGLGLRTSGAGDRRAATSVLKLKKGDMVEVRVFEVFGDPTIISCAFTGFKLH